MLSVVVGSATRWRVRRVRSIPRDGEQSCGSFPRHCFQTRRRRQIAGVPASTRQDPEPSRAAMIAIAGAGPSLSATAATHLHPRRSGHDGADRDLSLPRQLPICSRGQRVVRDQGHAVDNPVLGVRRRRAEQGPVRTITTSRASAARVAGGVGAICRPGDRPYRAHRRRMQ